MERKASVLVDDSMSRIGAALKTDDDVRLTGKHIRDLSFSLVAPVGADDRTHHKKHPFFLAPHGAHTIFILPHPLFYDKSFSHFFDRDIMQK